MTHEYQIHAVSRAAPSPSHLVPISLPSLPSLPPSHILIQTRLLSLTANNLTYFRAGQGLAFFAAWPLPAIAPSPYNDNEAYARVPAWGFVEVLASTVPQVAPGSVLWAMLPIGTLPEMLHVTIEDETGHVLIQDEHRKPMMNMYNRMALVADAKYAATSRETKALTALVRPVFETGFMLNRYAFSWDETVGRTHPLGLVGGSALGPQNQWTAEDADLAGAVVVIMAGSAKTALSLAWELRHSRPAEKQPSKIVAVGSAGSRDLTVRTGLYDDFFLYDDINDVSSAQEVLGKLSVGSGTKAVMFSFTTHGNAVYEWLTALRNGGAKRVQAVMAIWDPSRPDIWARMDPLLKDAASGVVRCNASTMRDWAMPVVGKAKHFGDLEAAWDRMVEGGSLGALGLEWGSGMDDVKRGWEGICEGKYRADTGLVYEL